jgi:hypothetical protein
MDQYQRRTLFSLESLVDIVNGRTPSAACDECEKMSLSLRKSLLMGICISKKIAADEIGILFLSGDKEAEKPLVDLLQDPELNMTAYQYLFYNEEALSKEGAAIFDAFESIIIDSVKKGERFEGMITA